MGTTPTPRRNKREGSTKLANPQNQFSDEQTPMDIHQDVSQKLDPLLHGVTDLSMWVAAFKGRHGQGEASVMASPPTSPHRRRARHQVTPASYDEIAPAPARPGTKACLLTINRAFNHPEVKCIRKGYPHLVSPSSPSWIVTKHNGYRPGMDLDMRLDLIQITAGV